MEKLVRNDGQKLLSKYRMSLHKNVRTFFILWQTTNCSQTLPFMGEGEYFERLINFTNTY